MASFEEDPKEVPLGVRFGEKEFVPDGNGSFAPQLPKDIELKKENQENPRTKFIYDKCDEDNAYAWFVDDVPQYLKLELIKHYANDPDREKIYYLYKNGNERRLRDFTGVNNIYVTDDNGNKEDKTIYGFGDVLISESDPLYCREIIPLDENSDDRFKFFQSLDETKRENFQFYRLFSDGTHGPVGKYNSYNEPSKEEPLFTYFFINENGYKSKVNSDERLYYFENEPARSGGRRKRRTKAKKSKKRRTNKKSKSRS